MKKLIIMITKIKIILKIKMINKILVVIINNW